MDAVGRPTRRHVLCPFVSDDVGGETLFPQMSGSSSSAGFKISYWRCMAVLFASVRRFDRTARCSIVTNTDPSRYCDGEILQTLADLRVEIDIVPFETARKRSTPKFGNVLYMFDVLRWLGREGRSDAYLCLDPDCIFAGDPAPIWRNAQERGLLYYDVGTPRDGAIADLSLARLEDFAAGHDWALRSQATHVGGEFLAVSRSGLARLVEDVETITTADAGGLLTMEEHVLSLVVSRRGLGGNAFNQHVKRIWTGPRRHNARPEDGSLLLWHLPREKEFGFSDLYGELKAAGTNVAWTDLPAGEYVPYIAERMGVPRWSARKWVHESPKLVARLVRGFGAPRPTAPEGGPLGSSRGPAGIGRAVPPD